MFSHISWLTCLVYIVTGVHPPQMAVLLCTLQYGIEYSSTASLFKPRMSGSKLKSSSDVAGTNVLFKVLLRLKMFYFLCLFLCILYVKTFTNLLQYSTVWPVMLG